MAGSAMSIVTASAIQDAAGDLLAQGFITFQPIDANGNPCSFGLQGGGFITAEPVTRPVTNGAIVGALALARSDMSIPVGVNYRITVTLEGAGEYQSLVLGIASVAAPTFDLDSFAPSTVQTAPPAAWVVGTTGSGGSLATPVFSASASGLAAGSAPTAFVTGTYPDLNIAFGIPQGAQGATGAPGAPASTTAVGGSILSVGSIAGLAAAAEDSSGNVTWTQVPSPVLNGPLLVKDNSAAALTVGTGASQFVVNNQENYFGITAFGLVYGISGALPAPPGTATLGGYFSGLGVGGSTAGTGKPIFGVLTAAQAKAGIHETAFTVLDTNLVQTFNNTLDDGSGNIAVAGALTLGATVPSAAAVTHSAGNGLPTAAAANGSTYSNLTGGAGSTFFVRVAGAWQAIA